VAIQRARKRAKKNALRKLPQLLRILGARLPARSWIATLRSQ
jgi:hypothetical protein